MSELPLLAFTVLTGMAAGGYVMDTVFVLISKRRHRSQAFSLVCLVALAVGMLCVLAHLGHPERFLNAMANPTSMIAQEAYWSIPFGCLLLLDVLLLGAKGSGNKVVPVLGSVLGVGLMVVTSLAYFTSYGVAGWPEVPTLFLFFVGDIALGAAFAIALQGSRFGETDASGHSDEGISSAKAIPGFATALYAALVVVLAAEAVVFAGLEAGPWAFVASAVLSAAACVLQVAEMLGKAKGRGLRWACFALVALSVVVSRCAFYAMA